MEKKMLQTIEKIGIVVILLIAATLLVLLTYKGNDSAAAEFVYSVKEDGYASIEGYTGDKAKLFIPEKVGENGEYTVRYINAEAFANDTALKTVIIPNTVCEIGKYAFSGCENLKTVELSDGLLSIGYGAFFRCEKLKNVSLPETLQKIDDSAFEDCKRLKKLYVPSACKEIGTDAFLGCENLILDCSDNEVARSVAEQYRIPKSFSESPRSTLLKAGVLSIIVLIAVFSAPPLVKKLRARKKEK
ncbi:MAG: hypothetical protein E7626_07125 [Ruminococcaceae bacterium]|nr:hypothetical protein [Oscillospiraceae bacterium]